MRVRRLPTLAEVSAESWSGLLPNYWCIFFSEWLINNRIDQSISPAEENQVYSNSRTALPFPEPQIWAQMVLCVLHLRVFFHEKAPLWSLQFLFSALFAWEKYKHKKDSSQASDPLRQSNRLGVRQHRITGGCLGAASSTGPAAASPMQICQHEPGMCYHWQRRTGTSTSRFICSVCPSNRIPFKKPSTRDRTDASDFILGGVHMGVLPSSKGFRGGGLCLWVILKDKQHSIFLPKRRKGGVRG